MKPTVSDMMQCLPEGRVTRRAFVSNVSKSLQRWCLQRRIMDLTNCSHESHILQKLHAWGLLC